MRAHVVLFFYKYALAALEQKIEQKRPSSQT